ncbi:MAG: efflux RND transporter periplasmic adaptor subunit [Deltaproteobacteria bacterium]|nr:efflux RND transporter periplasmic adaptor subunit [Deltaproteobacteria bacterium]
MLKSGGRVVGALLLVALTSACRRAEPRALHAEAPPPLSITAAAVVVEVIERKVEIPGTLAAWEEATVSLEVEGRISEINADLGDSVQKGAVLARLTPAELAWKKAQADADLAAAEADFNRLADLGKQSLVSKQQLEEGRRRLDVARAAADLAAKKYADTSLRAPFAGQVAKRLVNAGEYVRVGTPAFQVVNSTLLKFRGEVPQRFAADVKVGDQATAFADGDHKEGRTGSIVRIGPAVTLESRSFPIEARIDNADGRIKAGTFARLSIGTSGRIEALTVPEAAVSMFAGNPRVFVIDGDHARETPIEVSGKSDAKVLVQKGLTVGQRVAVTGVELLADGRAVSVR